MARKDEIDYYEKDLDDSTEDTKGMFGQSDNPEKNKSWESGFGVSVDNDSMESDVLEDVPGASLRDQDPIGDANSRAAANNKRYEELDVLDGEQWKAAGEAVGSAALDFLNEKIEKIRRAWTTTKEVPISGIIEDVALAAINIDDLGGDLLHGLEKVTAKLLDVSSSGENNPYLNMLANLGGDFLDSINGDPEVQKAIASLDIVKGVAITIDTIDGYVKAIKQIWDALEPIFPWIQIACDFAALFGTGVPKAFNEMSVEQQKLILKLISMTTELFRDILSNIKVQLPAILVDSAALLLEDTTRRGWGNGQGGMISQAFFSESFHSQTMSDLKSEYSNSKWYSYTDDVLTDWKGSVGDLYDYGIQTGRNQSGTLGKVIRSLDDIYLNSFTKNFLGGVSSIASAAVYKPSVWYENTATTNTENPGGEGANTNPQARTFTGFTPDDIQAAGEFNKTELGLVKPSHEIYESEKGDI